MYVIPSLRGGGSERVATVILRGLNRNKYRPLLVVMNGADGVYNDQLPPDVDFLDLKTARVRHALPKIIKLIHEYKPDVVLSGLSHLNIALAIFRFCLPRASKMVARETNILSKRIANGRARLFWTLLYRQFYKNFDCIICQSRDMKEDLATNFNIPANKLCLIPNPVDRNFIVKKLKGKRPPKSLINGKINLIAVGRLEKQKGFDVLINALGILNNKRINLFFLGKGSEEINLRQKVVELNLSAQVQFVGFRNNPFLWMKFADALILPSRYEGMPNVVLEALACTLPVIASPALGGIKEILEDIHECSIAADMSAEALAEAISVWLEGDMRRTSVSAVEAYNSEKVIAKYECVLDAE